MIEDVRHVPKRKKKEKKGPNLKKSSKIIGKPQKNSILGLRNDKERNSNSNPTLFNRNSEAIVLDGSEDESGGEDVDSDFEMSAE